MDLLRSLIVPGSAAYAQWVSTAFQRRNSTSTPADESGVRRDSVHQSHHCSQPQSSHNVVEILDQLLKESDGEEMTIADQRNIQPLPTQEPGGVQAYDPTTKPVSERPVREQGTVTSNKLCFFWYHFGRCDRDLANPTKDGKLCPHVHALENGQDNIQLCSFRHWMHKGPCGLALCPLKDVGKPKKKPKKITADKCQVDTFHQAGEQLSSVKAAMPDGANDAKQQLKRKAPIRHRDEPLAGIIKRQKISYDDEAAASDEVDHQDETCYCWYHAGRPRTLDASNNFQCSYQQAFINPISITHPAPTYEYGQLSRLKHCAAERENMGLDPKMSPNKDLFDRVGKEVDSLPQDGLHQNISKSKKKRQREKAKRTCFFWYHGGCKRGSEPGEQPCPMRHEMRDPPKMVEPPPGYVHKEQCELEWCPGDAEERKYGDGWYKRYFETGSMEGEESDGDEDGQEQDWHLAGFEDC